MRCCSEATCSAEPIHEESHVKLLQIDKGPLSDIGELCLILFCSRGKAERYASQPLTPRSLRSIGSDDRAIGMLLHATHSQTHLENIVSLERPRNEQVSSYYRDHGWLE